MWGNNTNVLSSTGLLRPINSSSAIRGNHNIIIKILHQPTENKFNFRQFKSERLYEWKKFSVSEKASFHQYNSFYLGVSPSRKI